LGKEMTAVTFDVVKLAAEYNDKTPSEILALAIEHFEDLSISFSGAEDVVLIDMAVQIKPDIKVFSLDTGRLHPETYQFIERVRDHYNINIDLLSPDPKQLEKFVHDKGLYSFYQDGHQECCGIRKVMPLRRILSTLDAWITGQRQDQSPDTRQGIPVLQKDNAFSSADHTLIKFNPLANWTSQQVWQYIRENDVPFNELHAKGFASIGCEPCTRAILPNQHEREGRWWWEEATKKECGLHIDNIKK
jgi:phosphoadenosine phosphosulfate reductase